MVNENAKTYAAESLDECRKALYKMYGKNYRLIGQETKYKPSGFLGLRTKPYVSVSYVTYDTPEKADYPEQPRESDEERMEKNRQAILSKAMVDQLSKFGKNLDDISRQLNDRLDNLSVSAEEKHPTIKKIEELLEENEFTFSYIQMIEEKIRSEFSLEQLEDFKLVERYVVDWIGESVSIAPERTFRPPHVVIIVGPTGVGKTTTIAKLAANTILEAKKQNRPKPEICIITIDTMRVGSMEQLSKFGEILGKNVQKAERMEDLKEIFEENRDHVDYVFIDTSGYSPNDSTHIGSMKNILSVENMNADVYLSLCATTKASDLVNIIRNYEPFGYDSVIVTKCDETKQFGNVISVLWDKHKSISYITDGQGVPRNIRRADIIDILKNLNGFCIDRVHIEDKFGEK